MKEVILLLFIVLNWITAVGKDIVLLPTESFLKLFSAFVSQ